MKFLEDNHICSSFVYIHADNTIIAIFLFCMFRGLADRLGVFGGFTSFQNPVPNETVLNIERYTICKQCLQY